MTPKSTKEFFTLFSDLDKNYHQLVNTGFCTKICMGNCEKKTDPCYTKFKDVPAKTWEKEDRTWADVKSKGFSMNSGGAYEFENFDSFKECVENIEFSERAALATTDAEKTLVKRMNSFKMDTVGKLL
jgi:hypothetical protein